MLERWQTFFNQTESSPRSSESVCVFVCVICVINTAADINTNLHVLQYSQERYQTRWSEENRRSTLKESNSTGSEVRGVCTCLTKNRQIKQYHNHSSILFVLCFDSMSSNQLGDVGMVVLAQALKVNHVLHTLR